jgi:hypothetical protein
MRVLLGMIVGGFLVVAVAYIHDTTQLQSAAPAGLQPQTVVNWQIARQEVEKGWSTVSTGARSAWLKMSAHI